MADTLGIEVFSCSFHIVDASYPKGKVIQAHSRFIEALLYR
jgi:hypothetical protein